MSSTIRVRRGHDLQLAGRPEPSLADAPRPAHAALQPADFPYVRPRLRVKEGDAVKIGTPLFESKDDPRIVFVSPAGGTVSAVRYGERRKLLEIVVELAAEEAAEDRGVSEPAQALELGRGQIVERLLEAGLWPLLRQRPFSKIADPDGKPKALVVTATPRDAFDADPDLFLKGCEADFQFGLDLLAKLTDGPVYLCVMAGASAKALVEAKNVQIRRFDGPYAAGDAGVQIYHLCPPRGKETVWYVGCQDVLAIARLFHTGRYDPSRVVAAAGPGFTERKLLRTRTGASVRSLSEGRTGDGELRFVSGGPLNGRAVAADGYLGYYDTSLTALPEGRSREFLGFLRPGWDKYSTTRSFLSTMFRGRDFPMTTNRNGSLRNFVMTDVYEDVCPVGLWPEHIAKAVLADDIEEADKLGILDCVQCGLCTFVCPSKIEVAGILRRGIDQIHKEG